MLKEKTIIKLFSFPILGKKIFQPWFVNKEGGSQKSKSLRCYYTNKFRVDVGMYTYGGCFSPDFNYAIGGCIEIGRYGSFAQDIHYFAANHPVSQVSMSPFFYSKTFGFDVEYVKREKLTIGHGVWCGYGALITNKCTCVGNGAVIAAGSVVTKNVPPYAIVAGNPAKIIKFRFSKNEIEQIEETKWWEKTPEELMKLYNQMKQPREFVDAYWDVYNKQ